MTRTATAMEEAFLRLPPKVLDTSLGKTIFDVAVRRAEYRAKPRTHIRPRGKSVLAVN